MNSNQQLINIIKKAIDLHVHIGPEIIPRKYTCDQLVKQEKGRIKGMALKNHFYPTAPLITSKLDEKMLLISSIVLNNAVGGLNSDAILATSYIAKEPFIVWLPTINAAQFLSNSKYEVAPEWINKSSFRARKSNEVKKISLINSKGKLTKKALSTLQTIKYTNAILATGHISWRESQLVVKQAICLGINKIIVTHPIYQRINMPISVQKELARCGAFIEFCYSMYSIDKIGINKIVDQINEIGYQYCILSSDVGQTFSPPPSKALLIFAKLLLAEGISINKLEKMLVDNPQKIISRAT